MSQAIPKLITVCFADHPAGTVIDGVRESAEVVRAVFGRHRIEAEDWSELGTGADFRAKFADTLTAATSQGVILYWIGHGYVEEGHAFYLATPSTDLTAAHHEHDVSADWLGEQLFTDQKHRLHEPAAWRLIIIDSCESGTGVALAERKFPEDNLPNGRVLVGTTPTGAAFTGTFAEILDRRVMRFERQTAPIRVSELRRLLAEHLDENLVRGQISWHATIPPPIDPLAEITATVSDRDELLEAISKLPNAAISHLIPKAQGGESGDPVWHFEGRQNERLQINKWLNTVDGGLLVVTGEPGAGKSALLGMTYASTLPNLMKALADLGYQLDGPGLTPRSDVTFDAILHLSGLNIANIIQTLVSELELNPTDSIDDVIAQIRRMSESRRLTLIIDALDEAQDPIGITQGVIRRLAVIPNCRTLLGTRVALQLDPDQRTANTETILNLLSDVTGHEPLRIKRDQWAIQTYVTKRLRADLPERAEEIGGLVGGRDQPFLFARLAVHEILANPQILDDPETLREFLDSGHRGIFARAVDRINAQNPKAGSLLWALAYARGRGFPIIDGIWQVAATALHGSLVLAPDVSDALELAGPYIVVDQEFDQAAYRLAHRTFQEFFIARDYPTRDDRTA